MAYCSMAGRALLQGMHLSVYSVLLQRDSTELDAIKNRCLSPESDTIFILMPLFSLFR